MQGAGDLSPALSVLIALLWVVPSGLHMIEDPVPHNEEPGDDHVGEHSCSEECTGDDEFVVHAHQLMRELSSYPPRSRPLRGSRRPSRTGP